MSDKPILTVTRAALLKDGSDTAFRQLVHDLLAFSARLEEIRSRLGAHIGLSGIQYSILISVRHHTLSGPVGVKAIADHLALSGAFVTIETNKLVKKGLLTKESNPDDRRRVLLNVTPLGRDLLAELATVQRQANDALFDGLNADDFADLSRMAAVMKKDADKSLLLLDYLTNRSRDR